MALCQCRKNKQQKTAARTSDLLPLPRQLSSNVAKGRNALGGANLVDYTGWTLVWSDEFDSGSRLNDAWWNYENGFVRNNEAQWYQPDNAYLQNGKLIIEGRKVDPPIPCPWFISANNSNWRYSRPNINYTSASVNTQGKKQFLYGRFEVSAKIPVASGAWPAIWTLGLSDMQWPSCGEIDIMEYCCRWPNGVQTPYIQANFYWGTNQYWIATGSNVLKPLSYFTAKDPNWADKFHVWRMDWDATSIQIFLDDELITSIDPSQTVNGSVGNYTKPFQKPQYLLLNLAMGGSGGTIDDSALPFKFEIEYVRVYQKV